MLFNCCRHVKYQRLNETSRKYSNLTLFCVLLVLIAILNFISPCDGRGGNIFTIVYGRIMGTYNGTYPPLTEPFVYNISGIAPQGDQHISLTALFSSVSKITCALNSSDSDPSQMVFEELADTRFYVRTKQLTQLNFHVEYSRSQEQRLFCKISGLLYEPYHIEYFESAPMLVSFDDIAMVDKRTSADSVIFSYLPKNVVWSSSPPVDKTRVVVCQEKPFR
ncbi:hypothetical protein WA556_002906, partial [Blastocystis sp. ATCC 50177/Nand II]